MLRNTAAFDSAQLGLRVIRVGATTLRNPLSWFRLLQVGLALRRSGHKLSHVFFNDSSVMVPPAFRLFGIRCLISRRDLGYWYTPGYLAALRLTRHFIAGAVVNSQAVKSVTMENENIPSGKVEVIYNGYEGLDLDRRSGGSANPVPTQHECLAVLVANIRPIKRIDDAIRAIAQARVSGVDIGLMVIGDGASENLQELAGHLGIGSSVHFVGPRTDVSECLKSADVGILCSDSEGFSNAVVEYMVAGLPVVCSAVGGNVEAIRHGETGYLFEKGDWKSMAEFMVTLVNNRALRSEMSRNAREFAEQRFSMDSMMRSHVRLYKRVLNLST